MTVRLDDLPLRRSMTALRWVIAFAYIALGWIHVLEVAPAALAMSGGALVAANVVFTWQQVVRAEPDPRVATAFRFLDVALTSVILVALHDVRSPVWAIYFLIISASAHLITQRAMLVYAAWIGLNYAAAAGMVAAQGYPVAWPYVIVVSVCIQLMGLNATMIAGGEQRLRGIISELAVTDSLTGLPNRRRFHQMYAATLHDAIAARTPLALMLVDVDHFKRINDEQGHPAGDERLREIAASMRAVLRRGDLVARFGGDEFIVVAPHSARDEALTLAERLRAATMESGTSVSIGVAIFPEDAQREDALIAAADVALYAAKQAGRNCVREAA